MRSAISAAASSSRIPARVKLAGPCVACRRHLHASAPLSVFRPQEPYDCPRPDITPDGRRVLPWYQKYPKIDESAELDPVWDRLCQTTEKREGPWAELQKMAEGTGLGFYERYGAHDGYGLRNRERWRKDADGKMELWTAAGSQWKEALGFKRGGARPGKRIEVDGFKHRKSFELDQMEDREAGMQRRRLEYRQPEGASWGKRISAVGEGGGSDGDGGQVDPDQERWNKLRRRGEELEEAAVVLEQLRLHEEEEEEREHERNGTAPAEEDDDEMRYAPTMREERAAWAASQRNRRDDEWSGESDFDPRDDLARMEQVSKKRNERELREFQERRGREFEYQRNVPPHVQHHERGHGGDIAFEQNGVEDFVPRQYRQTRGGDTAGAEGGRGTRRAEWSTRAGASRGPEPRRVGGTFGIRRDYSTAVGQRRFVSTEAGRSAGREEPEMREQGTLYGSSEEAGTRQHAHTPSTKSTYEQPMAWGPPLRLTRESTLPQRNSPPRPTPPAQPTPQSTTSASKGTNVVVRGTNDAEKFIKARKCATASWKPKKKLTFSAMAGLRELHLMNPERHTRKYLAKEFGISYEAVRRILRSKWRYKRFKVIREEAKRSLTWVASDQIGKAKSLEKRSLEGTKWDPNPETALGVSPIHEIRRTAWAARK